ncbi:hypothetical protein ABZS81_22980 [Streptomyces sp. NPDC005318]|uniref:hypothetical protein n=1 Tax=unclassified Streptomyces TaxID=2593676 RepID=UPI0023F79622|nr:hypothetical protein [Streptomyces sp. JH14]MDF6042700.1 hypothetical protein [Streptomyces sp. JH14]
MMLVLPGVVRAVGGDAVDRQQRAVQDHERQKVFVLGFVLSQNATSRQIFLENHATAALEHHINA